VSRQQLNQNIITCDGPTSVDFITQAFFFCACKTATELISSFGGFFFPACKTARELITIPTVSNKELPIKWIGSIWDTNAYQNHSNEILRSILSTMVVIFGGDENQREQGDNLKGIWRKNVLLNALSSVDGYNEICNKAIVIMMMRICVDLQSIASKQKITFKICKMKGILRWFLIYDSLQPESRQIRDIQYSVDAARSKIYFRYFGGKCSMSVSETHPKICRLQMRQYIGANIQCLC